MKKLRFFLTEALNLLAFVMVAGGLYILCGLAFLGVIG